MDSRLICMGAHWLVIIGALNWGLVGLGYFLNQDLNLVAMLLGQWPVAEAVVYLLVGVSAVAKFTCKKC